MTAGYDRLPDATPTATFRLTPRQLEVMCEAAFGGTVLSGSAPPRTIKVLVDRGYLEPVEHEKRDVLGPFRWIEYVMPIPVHMAFCEWCANQADPVDL